MEKYHSVHEEDISSFDLSSTRVFVSFQQWNRSTDGKQIDYPLCPLHKCWKTWTMIDRGTFPQAWSV